MFRKPVHTTIFCALVGQGIQLLCMLYSAIWLTMAGTYSPVYKGTLLMMLAMLYPVFGAVNGYYSSKLYTLFNSTNTRLLTVLQVFGFPCFLFTALSIIDVLEYIESGFEVTMSLVTVSVGVGAMLIVNAPFVFIGSWFGQNTARMTVPQKPNRVKRDIPRKKWYVRFVPNVIVAAIVPSLVIYYELDKIVNAIQGS